MFFINSNLWFWRAVGDKDLLLLTYTLHFLLCSIIGNYNKNRRFRGLKSWSVGYWSSDLPLVTWTCTDLQIEWYHCHAHVSGVPLTLRHLASASLEQTLTISHSLSSDVSLSSSMTMPLLGEFETGATAWRSDCELGDSSWSTLTGAGTLAGSSKTSLLSYQ